MKFNQTKKEANMFNKLRDNQETPSLQPGLDMYRPGEVEALNAISAARLDLQRAEAESRKSTPDMWKKLDEWSMKRGASEPFTLAHQRFDLDKRARIDPKLDAYLSSNIALVLNNMREVDHPVTAASNRFFAAEEHLRNLDENMAAESAAEEAVDQWSMPFGPESLPVHPPRHDASEW